MTMELLKRHIITARIELLSGLHIGAGKDAVEIGGIDSPVIRNPVTREPYIPGSSVKGKLRSLLEWALGCIEDDGRVWGGAGARFDAGRYLEWNSQVILRAFGTTLDGWDKGPSRLIVRDAPLDADWVEMLRAQALPLTEEKTEVSIDRIEGKAARMGPRRMERVPAGARFNLELVFKVFSVDDDGGEGDMRCLQRVLEALRLLEQDALGGSGSRGYGRVRIDGLSVDGQSVQEAFESIHRVDSKQENLLFEAAANA